jgi:diguanylate cyclase (GGDEF)-like protein
MTVADGSDRPDPAIGQDAAPGELRDHVLWGLALHFTLVMLLVTVIVTSRDGLLVLQLALLAVSLPLSMAALARAILGSAARLDVRTEQLRSAYSQARLDALLDPITGLGNHRAFQEELHRQIESAARHGYSLALAILDLDDLKGVNDEHGHAGGDQLLGSMGRLLSTASRGVDRGYRIGGDEFALLLPHTDVAAAHAAMRRILAAAVSGENTFGRSFSFSAGVTAFPDPTTDGRHLLANADTALYWAKRHGRTDIQVFDRDRHGDAHEARSTAELAAAIDVVKKDRAITPVFQPIFDLATGATVGFEGLVRPKADAGFRDASALFMAAEVAERTVEIDMLAIETIASGLTDEIGDRYLSVNLSPRSLETDQFRVVDLEAVLRAHGLAPDRVVLELTEREAVEDMARLRANLDACQAAGFRVAADDVGAGNAGLRLLSEIRFDMVKIDLSLVQGGVLRDAALSVLRAIQDMASHSRARVVAEGIETVEQLTVVRRLGVATGQGYLLSAPGPSALVDAIDIDQLLASHEARRRALLDGWDGRTPAAGMPTA